MRLRAVHVRREAGFSLIEMLVAVTIGLFLLGGAIAMLVTTRQTYVAQNDFAQIQEGARFTMDTMVHDVRMAGYVGCMHSMEDETLENVLRGHPDNGGTAGSLYDTSRPLEGLESGAGTPSWLPSANATDFVVTSRTAAEAVGNAVPNSDAITVRSAGGANTPVIGTATPAGTVTIDNRLLGLQNGDVVMVSDCQKASIFTVTNDVTPAVNQGLAHATRAGEAGNAVATLGNAFSDAASLPAIVSPMVAVRYYVGISRVGPPQRTGLFRRVWVGGGTNAFQNQLLIDGVERMEITYGVDTNGDGLPDAYVQADDARLGATANNWNNVISVRVGLLIRSLEPNSPEQDTRAFTVNGTDVDAANDNYRRRLVTTTIFIRNDTL